MKAKDFGNLPAYPGQIRQHGENIVEVLSIGGLTKREAFAMAALPSIIVVTSAGQHKPPPPFPGATAEACIAASAFAVADAMLAEAAKDQPA